MCACACVRVCVCAGARRAAVTALNDALLVGQEQVYRPLEEGVVPALQKSSTFGNFVDDLSSLEVGAWCMYLFVLRHFFLLLLCKSDTVLTPDTTSSETYAPRRCNARSILITLIKSAVLRGGA